MKLLGGLVLIALLVPATADAKRQHIRIYKPSQQPATVPLIVVPVVAPVFDLIRRTSCDPAIAVSTGPGDPGFDPAGPLTGNFLIPAIWARCNPVPIPQRRRR